MMIKILKWTGIVLGALIGLAALVIIALFAVGNARLARTYQIRPEMVAIPSDAASIAQGKQLVTGPGLCTDCHGDDLSGKVILDDPKVGYLPGSNLTPGNGGSASEFTDADWVLALRHGVSPEGKALLAMPSENYYYLSDQDLGAIIAYLKSLPPVDRNLGETKMSLLGKTLLAAGAFGKAAIPAEFIDHTGPRPAAVEPGINIQYGDYLVRIAGCRDCHGEDLAGGRNAAPGAPFAPSLTPAGSIGAWSKETFINDIRTSQASNSQAGSMPWSKVAQMTDGDLEAMYLYLRSLLAIKNDQ
jgi:mono/diheme cytochrome c family protein